MIDFRSDTVTKPTQAMREAMRNATVGDDVYGDDETINTLEKTAANLVGKEAALFVPSGTMGNQIAIMVHTSPGDEIILGQGSHIKNYEVGAASALSGVGYHLVPDDGGHLEEEATLRGIRGENIHFPKTTLILSETAHSSGKVAPLKTLEVIGRIAKDHGIAHHLDGARVFNAAVALGEDVKEITRHVDSVMFCLSKGLASPVGSILAGSKPFIEKARKYRKMLGGGMRQAGVLAAPGLISLNTMCKRLNKDHENAEYLAKRLYELGGFEVDLTARDINMVFVRTKTHDLDMIANTLEKQGILLGGYKGDYMRLMTHNDIRKEDIDTLIEALHAIIQ